MITALIIILIIVIALAIPIAIFLWLIKNTDWDQQEDRLFCSSYRDMQTTQSNDVASNPGEI